uniref:DNA2/NAM7 helicase-like C-terminal domain-containing protein n=1 Tax=Daucus carota subsp. sativus TaxID=79200 RepID=A0A175YEM1_DAUCS
MVLLVRELEAMLENYNNLDYNVGDPLQPPATVISPVAEKFKYRMSLFKRFQEVGYPALEDGPAVESETRRAWQIYSCFGPFCFFHLHERKESQPSNSGSWENVDEAEFVVLMYHKLLARFVELKSSSQIAIISPYRSQVSLFRDKFKDTFGEDSNKFVDINTVDGFQVVGSALTLRKDEHWKNLTESAEKRNLSESAEKRNALYKRKESRSWENVDEAEFVVLMYHKLLARFVELKSSSQIAIISPYRSQVSLFRDKFKDAFGEDSKKFVDINTVDGFQGREKDVAIFSCVRASKDKGIGFVSDSRRMNVGITRARSSVWLCLYNSSCLFVYSGCGFCFNFEKRRALEESHRECRKEESHRVQKRGLLFIRFRSRMLIFSVRQTLPELQEVPNDDIGFDMAIDVNVDDGPADVQDWGGGDAEGFDGAGDDD